MTNHDPSRGARALVLAGPAFSLVATVFSLVTGTGLPLGGVWFVAGLWTFLAALAHILWRAFRYGDWSAFGSYEFTGDDGERFDWATRTGRYAWRRDLEEQELHGHDS